MEQGREDTYVREPDGEPRPDTRVGQLVGNTGDQEERQSVLMESVWKKLQDEAVEKVERLELGATTERSRVDDKEGESNTAVVAWLVGWRNRPRSASTFGEAMKRFRYDNRGADGL